MIDNCDGEYYNYHLGIGEFFDEMYRNCEIKLDETLFRNIDYSDSYDPKSILRYIINKDDFIEFTREESSKARKDYESLNAFLNKINNEINKYCE